MDLATWTILGLVALLSVNQAVMHVPAVRDRAWAFWTVNLVDLLAGLGVLVFGLPGYEHVPPVRWIVGLLFILHVAQNLKLKSDRDAEARKARKAEILEERRRQQDEREPDA